MQGNLQGNGGCSCQGITLVICGGSIVLDKTINRVFDWFCIFRIYFLLEVYAMKDKSFSVTDADTIIEYKGKLARLEKRHAEIMAELQSRELYPRSDFWWSRGNV